ncbi:TPA: hypothetical protein L9Y29_004984, partial [Klebsiella pneumoniae]|nr:hypothetical protein [Klebsiella pneumoniae]HCI9317038.1 hypothetical protein [Klebsiella pneumoniae]
NDPEVRKAYLGISG